MGAAASKAKKDPAAKRKTKAKPESNHANPLKNAKSPQTNEPANPPPAGRTGSPAPRRAGSKVTAAAAVTSPSPGGGSRTGSPLSVRSASPSNAAVMAATQGDNAGLNARYEKLMGNTASVSPKTPTTGSTARTQSPKPGSETPEQVQRRWQKGIDDQLASPEIRSDSPARSVLEQPVDI